MIKIVIDQGNYKHSSYVTVYVDGKELMYCRGIYYYEDLDCITLNDSVSRMCIIRINKRDDNIKIERIGGDA